MHRTIKRVAVVGAGLIGSSWATFYLARGLEVVVTDTDPAREIFLKRFIQNAWPTQERLGLFGGADPTRLEFTLDLEAAVENCDFVQESGPEDPALKKLLFARIDAKVSESVIIASSSSGLKMSVIQEDCRFPQRCIIGHPFNPPHLMPLVELVGGAQTSMHTLDLAEQFYRSLGKRTIRLQKEVLGHVANRLQAALWREAVHLVQSGVISVAEADAAVTYGPGLRWAIMGPSMTFHLGGGEGGIEHFMHHLSSSFELWWRDLGQPELTDDVKALLVAGVKESAGGHTLTELCRSRDARLVEILAVLMAGGSAIV